MKKLAVLFSALLVVALAVPAFAGLNTDINGVVRTEVYYDQQDGLTARGSAEAKITMSAGSDGPLKAVVNLKAFEAGNDALLDFEDAGPGPFTKRQNVEFGFDAAYIQADGSWIKGMPSTTTKIGRFAINYSDWVGKFRWNNALEVSGIDLGVGALAVYTGWGNAWNHAAAGTYASHVTGITGSADIDVVNVKGTYVSTTNTATDVAHSDFAVEAGVSPVDGLELNAAFASDGASTQTAYKVGATLDTLPGLTLGVENWSTGDQFDPTWSARKDDEQQFTANGDRNKYTKDSKGFKVTANTVQSGIDLGLAYTAKTNFAGGSPENITEVTAGTSVSDLNLNGKVVMNSTKPDTWINASVGGAFSGVNAKYTLDINHENNAAINIHTIQADTSVDTPIADNVKLAGKVILQDTATIQTKFAADATWQAPNGINLGLHYANFDRGTEDHGWNGKNITEDASGADGFVVKAGVSVNF